MPANSPGTRPRSWSWPCWTTVDESVRRSATRSAGRTRPPGALAKLGDRLDDPGRSPAEKRAILEALGLAGPPGFPALDAAYLALEDPGLRGVALRSMALADRERARPAMVASLGARDPGLRLEAIRLLGETPASAPRPGPRLRGQGRDPGRPAKPPRGAPEARRARGPQAPGLDRGTSREGGRDRPDGRPRPTGERGRPVVGAPDLLPGVGPSVRGLPFGRGPGGLGRTAARPGEPGPRTPTGRSRRSSTTRDRSPGSRRPGPGVVGRVGSAVRTRT